MAYCVECGEEIDKKYEKKHWNQKYEDRYGVDYNEASEGDPYCCHCLTLKVENLQNAGLRDMWGD